MSAVSAGANSNHNVIALAVMGAVSGTDYTSSLCAGQSVAACDMVPPRSILLV